MQASKGCTEDIDGPRPLGEARLFHAGGGDVSANREAINASGALNRVNQH